MHITCKEISSGIFNIALPHSMLRDSLLRLSARVLLSDAEYESVAALLHSKHTGPVYYLIQLSSTCTLMLHLSHDDASGIFLSKILCYLVQGLNEDVNALMAIIGSSEGLLIFFCVESCVLKSLSWLLFP